MTAKTSPEVIVGAGLAGLLAAHAWPGILLFERGSARPSHRALLRFRSEEVSRLTGIEFRRVLVRKGIWSDGEFVQPSIAIANSYTLKVNGRIYGDRSIWNIEPVERYIAPPTFYEQMLDAVGSRIYWQHPFSFSSAPLNTVIVSTAPLPVTMDAVCIPLSTLPPFRRAAIATVRIRLRDVHAHQTVYFPDEGLALYRASITDDTFILEFAGAPEDEEVDRGIEEACAAFGVSPLLLGEVERGSQEFGKIEPLADAARKATLYQLTTQRSIYSLGRFATWRNILLDDVVKDIAVIKRLIRASPYDQGRIASSAR